MRLAALTGRFGRAVLLLVVGAVAGAAAAAIAAVPGNDGVIDACYQVQKDGMTPATGAANLRIIDPSAGQSCNASDEHALSWNASGPPGAEGAAGPQGPQGATGPQGASGPAGSTVSIDGQAFTLGDGKTLTGSSSPVPPLQAPPGGRKVATMTLAGGSGVTSSAILAWQLVGAHGLQIVIPADGAAPTLAKLCVTGKHISRVALTAIKNDGPQTLNIRDATVASYSPDGEKGKGGGTQAPTETVSFNFAKVKATYSPQQPQG